MRKKNKTQETNVMPIIAKLKYQTIDKHQDSQIRLLFKVQISMLTVRNILIVFEASYKCN